MERTESLVHSVVPAPARDAFPLELAWNFALNTTTQTKTVQPQYFW
jgi:hypothetical protein